MGNPSSLAVARSFALAHPELIYPSTRDSEAVGSDAKHTRAS
jgi:hypothetical protein